MKERSRVNFKQRETFSNKKDQLLFDYTSIVFAN